MNTLFGDCGVFVAGLLYVKPRSTLLVSTTSLWIDMLDPWCIESRKKGYFDQARNH